MDKNKNIDANLLIDDNRSARESGSGYTLREKMGNALNTNKAPIIASVLFVFFFNGIFFLIPDFRYLGVPLALLAIWLISWLKRTGWSDLGIFRPQNWAAIILSGLGVAVILQASALLQIKLGGLAPDISSFDQVKNNPMNLLYFLLVSWTTAGFGEELIWRGFMLKQIARLFNEQNRFRWLIGLVISSVVFGLIHFYQGIAGIVMTGFAGFIYGIVFLRFRKNLWAPIFAHGLTDSLAFLILYNWDAISRVLSI